MAIKKSIGRMLAHIDAVATVPFAFTSEITRLFQHPPDFATVIRERAEKSTFSTATPAVKNHLESSAVCPGAASVLFPPARPNKPIARSRNEHHQRKYPVVSSDLSDPKMTIQ